MSSQQEIAELARTLAKTHVVVEDGRGVVPMAVDASTAIQYLRTVRAFFASLETHAGPTAQAREWLLDNHYMVERQIRQIKSDLPYGFVRRLPRLASERMGYRTRVEDLADSICVQSSLTLDADLIQHFLTSYQDVAALTISELWAFPAVLRSSVVTLLIGTLDDLTDSVGKPPRLWHTDLPVLTLQSEEVLIRAIRCLQVLSVIEWQDLFEATSKVDQVLRNDPSAIYSRMDFATRNSYRTAVESIARGIDWSELEVVTYALDQASNAGDAREQHIGYWLVDRGRVSIEDALGYRPSGMQLLVRTISGKPTIWYLTAIALVTFGAWAVPAGYLALNQASLTAWIVGLFVTIIPASALAIALVQLGVCHLLPPRVLPKLDLRTGVVDEGRTLIVIPTLIGSESDVHQLLRKLEIHYLCNPEPGLHFALLTDFHDASSRDEPEDAATLQCLKTGIEILNRRHGKMGKQPFHALHRERLWNSSESRWMGWERKRGKLEELNHLLRGATNTSYVLNFGDSEWLPKVRFVITLDTDTALPRGVAVQLVGILAHPLNVAITDPISGRTTSGYTVIQPRVEVAPDSANLSMFTRLFAGDAGFDIYTRAVSDVYQDLFGEGNYIGKGIYDVDAFQTSVDNLVPDSTLASHDLFEGVHGRAALATDVVLYEEYPSTYLAYTRRLHRWVRGDWQLLPWLRRRVPTRMGTLVPNRLTVIDRWKIFDNMRRSLLAPALLMMIVCAWILLPGSRLIWTMAALLPPAGHLFTSLMSNLAHGARRPPLRPWRWGVARTIREGVGRWAMAIVFVVHETVVVVDAILRVLVRMRFTHKRLLEWTTAAQTTRLLAGRGPRPGTWIEMLPGVVITIGLAVWVTTSSPGALPAAIPLLILWSFAPEVAQYLSRSTAARSYNISEADTRLLRHVARRTWLFFETFVGPQDQWLPPDHYQEEPGGVVAHRTSPTNIAMHLLSTQAAYDLGFIGVSELVTRLRNSLDGLQRLERYRGHPYNWYETQRLEPLHPRYVSSVDSGNLAGALLVLSTSCSEVIESPILRSAQWNGVRDTLELILEDVHRLEEATARIDLDEFRETAIDLLHEVCDVNEDPTRWWATLHRLRGGHRKTLHRRLTTALEQGAHGVDLRVLRDLRAWLDQLERQLSGMWIDINDYLPWQRFPDHPCKLDSSGLDSGLRALSAASAQGKAKVERLADIGPQTTEDFESALMNAHSNCESLIAELETLRQRVEQEFVGMDFSMFYNEQRRLLHIGYDVDADRMDPHYYDLLASEARLASYIAIVKGDVPQEHWFALGRPVTSIRHQKALLSWSATMFEYLMPHLLMRSNENTLLNQSALVAIDQQMFYGRTRSVPWGISESSFYAFDASKNYQYRAFGVPGLGFKRGLSDDLVVSPYASLIALPWRPQAVIENLKRLRKLGVLGSYGLYEAIDFTEERVPPGRTGAIVRSYMGHHQGMCLLAIDNFLCDGTMVSRFHASPIVQTGEMLLNESLPGPVAIESPITETDGTPDGLPHRFMQSTGWTRRPDGKERFVHLLSNRRLTSTVTSDGGGGISWNDVVVTRWTPASTSESGFWLYVKDEESGDHWSAGRAPTGTWPDGARVEFHPHKVEFIRRDHGISLHMEISVSPSDDVEVRRVTVTNETRNTRTLSVASVAEPVIAAERDDGRHPTFSKLFLEAESVADCCGIVFRRRSKHSTESGIVVFHGLIADSTMLDWVDIEPDRCQFLGRHGQWRSPKAITESGEHHERTFGTVLDPVMAIQVGLELAPLQSFEFAFVTTVGKSRGHALTLARSYGSMHAVEWLFQDAARESLAHFQRTGFDPSALESAEELYAALIFPRADMRAAADVHPRTLASQPRLWGHGVSGDFPILLLQVFDNESLLVRETLAAHRYWQSCCVKVELVILNEMGSGYRDDTGDRIRRILRETGSSPLIGQRGGVFLIPGDRISDPDRKNLLAAASVLLDTRQGDLASQVHHRQDKPQELPLLPATESPEAVRYRTEWPTELIFDNGFGGFSPDGREYVIRFRSGVPPPLPWCNVIANSEFGSVVSESGLGYSWATNSSEHRLTPWYNDPVRDHSGEALYLRDEETTEVWSPTPLPAGQDSDFVIRHGTGYSEYAHESHGLVHRLRVFTPVAESAKIVHLRLVNKLARPRRLTLTYYAEWVLGTDRERTRPFIVPEYAGAHSALLAQCSWNPDFGERVAFLTSDRDVHGFTCDRAEFLGRDVDRIMPEALRRWGLSSEVRPGCDPCAALQVHVDLDPGEQLDTHFVLGEGLNRTAALDLVVRLRDPVAVREEWVRLREQWEDRLGHVLVETPDPALDLMLNRWLLYQSLSSRLFGRTGFYQSSGAFGFRDQLQDVMALLHTEPRLTREHILVAAAHQFEAGDVLHWWHPPADKGVRTRCSDDLLWLPFVTAHYVRATGDSSILSEVVPYLTAEPLRTDEHIRYGEFGQGCSATLLDHCRRALDRGFTSGQHGLPLIGDGDWNDGMDRIGSDGRGESVWLGWFLYATASSFAEFLPLQEKNELLERAIRLQASLEASGWDGAWYRRAFHDDSSIVGSAKSVECRIDSISQSWATLSHAARVDRASAALRAALIHLVHEPEKIVCILTPPFSRTRHDPGYIRGYPPGVRENGGQYTHAAAWLSWAFAERGNGHEAGRILKMLNPINHGLSRSDVEIYRVEPYVISADIYGVEPHKGRGGWTWYTGAASWTWRLGVEAVLGLRLENGNLVIDPCLPAEWPGYKATLRYDGGQLDIVVDNPDRVEHGAVSVLLDGEIQPSNSVPRTAGQHEVHVTMRPMTPLPALENPPLGYGEGHAQTQAE